MRTQSVLGRVLVCFAAFGILLPQAGYAVERKTAGPQSAAIRDVALDAAGTLKGRVLSVAGKPRATDAVQLRQQGRVAAQATTDPGGQFAVTGLRAGVYEISTSHGADVYRVWTNGTAPPSAQQTVLLVDKEPIVRGQNGHWRQFLIVSGLVVTAGVIGGVIGYNIKDDDDEGSL